MNIIKLKNISKTYFLGKIKVSALDNINLEISKGDFVAIMGHSGSGKSTLLNLLGLLDKPTSGSYLLLNKEVAYLSDDELSFVRNELFGFVFQNFNLLSRITAEENVALPNIYSTHKTNLNPIELLKKVGLEERIHHKPTELSGGQQQRVAIARALVNNPIIIFADEPTGNLDSKSAKEIIDLLVELNNSGITVIMVTHEPDLAQVAKRIIKLHDGKIISDERIKPINCCNETQTNIKNIQHHKIINYQRIKDYFTQALKSLLSNKTRSVLSILGVLVGVTCLIAMLALGQGAQEEVKKSITNLGSNILMVRPSSVFRGGIALSQGSVTRFTLSDVFEIKKIPGVTNVTPYLTGNGQVVYKNKNWNTRIVGTTVNYQDIRNSYPPIGRFFTENETIQRSKVAVIGKTVKESLFGDKNPVGEFIKIRKIDFQVIGVLPEKGQAGWQNLDDQIIIPINTAMYRLLGKDYVDYIDVQVSEEKLMERVALRIKKLIVQLHRLSSDAERSIDIRNMAELQATISSTTKTFSYLLGSIAFVSLLVGGIGIMNIMLVSVTERTREIGLRKAIGANNKDILMQFIIESITICLVGGIMGILSGTIISLGLSKFAGWSTAVTLPSIILAFSFSFIVGFIFGLWPARKASLLNPIEALRYE
ncbi:MAG: ABC transporter permease [Endomicrobiia bacterium]